MIGAGRCGTTSLHLHLNEHPEISMSSEKELSFFADEPDLLSGPPLTDPGERSRVMRTCGNWRRGVHWYSSKFDPGAPVRGESSPIYTSPWFSAACAARIAQMMPEVKLIYCVRDPVERAVSHLRYQQSIGVERRPADDALSQPGGLYAVMSRFASRLEPYIALFQHERILIVELEQLAARPRETMRDIFLFAGVDGEFWSSRFERRWNSAKRGSLGRALTRLRRLPAWNHIASRTPARTAWWLERLAAGGTDGARGEVSDETRKVLAASLADDAARLRQIAGRPFPSWSV